MKELVETMQIRHSLGDYMSLTPKDIAQILPILEKNQQLIEQLTELEELLEDSHTIVVNLISTHNKSQN